MSQQTPSATVRREHSGRRHAAAILGLAAAVLLSLAPRLAAASPAPGTIAPDGGQVPNYWYSYAQSHPSDTGVVDATVFAVGDPVNHLLFVGNQDAGTSQRTITKYDSDSLQPATPASDAPRALLSTAAQGDNNTGDPGILVDSADKALLFQKATNLIEVLDEQTLTEVGEFAIPSPVPAVPVHGVSHSFYAKTGELLVAYTVEETYGSLLPVNGLYVDDFRIGDVIQALRKGAQPTPAWSQPAHPSQCAANLSAWFLTAAPVRTDPDATGHAQLLMPCRLPGSGPVGGPPTAGIVAVDLGPQDANGKPCGALCPDGGSVTVTQVPGAATDFLFDEVSRRGFILEQDPAGTIVMTYSADLHQLIGRTSIGTSADADKGAVGLDQATGRLYAVFPHGGVIVVDGRRTPVSPGVRFTDLARNSFSIGVPVFPPSPGHPYTRFFVEQAVGDVQNGCPDGCHVLGFDSLADTLAVTTDPPPDNVDKGTTISTPPPAGSQITSQYGSSARAYGYHADMVGGPDGLETDVTFQTQPLPAGHGNRDVMGAEVTELGVRGAAVNGRAAALGANSQTAFGVQQCTDPAQLANCAPPPAGLPVGVPGPTSTGGQPWPYPDALCSQPGGSASSDVPGAHSDGDPKSAAQPGSAGAADATVTCTAGKIAGSALLDGSGTSTTSTPTLTVTHATSNSSISLAGDGSTITATAEADAQGVSIGGVLSFGDIHHRATTTAGGRPGTAVDTDSVTVSNVLVTIGGTTTPICTGQCALDQGTVDQINAALPPSFHVILPQRDDRYAHDCTSSSGTTTCKGSPGGYLAAIQASLPEQYGDQQFNGMSPPESTLLPALRVVEYCYQDGHPIICRQVDDFAGVQPDSEYGLQVLPPLPTEQLTSDLVSTEQSLAGVSQFVPGTPGTSGTGGGGASDPQGPGAALVNGQNFEQQVLSGLDWLRRSPLQFLQTLAFFGLLSLPLVLSRRRWTWASEPDV